MVLVLSSKFEGGLLNAETCNLDFNVIVLVFHNTIAHLHEPGQGSSSKYNNGSVVSSSRDSFCSSVGLVQYYSSRCGVILVMARIDVDFTAVVVSCRRLIG